MNFKEMVEADITSVFLNLDDFAETHEINGEAVVCVIDKDDTHGAGSIVNPMPGVFTDAMHLYIKQGDIKTPVEGERITVDGDMHIVRNVSREMGMIVITAEAFES